MILFLYNEALTPKFKKIRHKLCESLIENNLIYANINAAWKNLEPSYTIVCGPLEGLNKNYQYLPNSQIDNTLYIYSLGYMSSRASEFKKAQLFLGELSAKLKVS